MSSTSRAATAAPVLVAADDLLVHQTARSFSVVADPAPAWFDRFYYNLHPRGPGPTLVVGAGRYANAGVTDGYACLATATEQRNVRFSQTIAPGAAPTRIGPLRWEVLEPLRRWRLVLDAQAEDFALDVVWTARSQPYAVEPIAVAHTDGPATDFSHFFQPGTYTGTLTIDGQVHDVDGWYGMRDRSWGVRRTRERLGLHLWGGAQLDDRCIAVLYNEGRDGRPAHVDGAVLVDGEPDPVRVVAVEHDLRLDANGEFTDGRVAAVLETGERVVVEWESLSAGVYMAPAGYDGWHGRNRGDDVLEHERWPLDGGIVLRDLSLALTDKLCGCRVGDRSGTGVFELALSRSATYAYRPTLTA